MSLAASWFTVLGTAVTHFITHCVTYERTDECTYISTYRAATLLKPLLGHNKPYWTLTGP